MIRSFARHLVDSWAPAFGLAYRRLRDYRAVRRPAVPTPFGFTLAGNATLAAGHFEKDEIDIFIEYLQKASICIDVGANIGLYTCLAASRGKQVVAVEPLPSNLDLLYKNLIRNGLLNVEVFPLGLAAGSGIRRLFGAQTGASFLPGWADTSERYCTVVPVNTLDAIVGTRFDGLPLLIKMDVEGFETEVLEGAKYTLELNPKPVWMVEICLNQHHPGGLNNRFRETFEFFWRYGYHAVVAEPGQRPVDRDDVIRWAKQGAVDFGSHNYVFLEGAPC